MAFNLIDNQTTFITIELTKLRKRSGSVQTDLHDKDSTQALAIENENRKVQEAEGKKIQEVVKNGLLKGYNVSLVTNIIGVSIDYILDIQRRLAGDKQKYMHYLISGSLS